MKIMVTGSSGMLGIALCDILPKGDYKVIGVDQVKQSPALPRPHTFVKCDITDFSTLIKAVKGARPDFIIHAAAFTDVDGCESEPDKAESVNALGTRYVAEAAREVDAELLFISTDFVFDGQKREPYTESDMPNPLNVYGRSKLDGEKFVADIMKDKRYYIIRSSWLFGKGGRNFVDTILKKAETEKDIRIISDQFGSPTYTFDLAGAIKNMLDYCRKKKIINGIYHITNSDNCSWYKLAQKTLKLANIYGIELIPIISTELNQAAQRPTMSILDNNRYRELFGRPLRAWYKALEEHILSRGKRYV